MHVADVPLGAETSRFDYQSFNPQNARLYIAEMGSGKLLVFDTRSRTLIAALDGFPKVTGVLVVPSLHKVYASVPGGGIGAALSVAAGIAGLSNGTGQLVVVDENSLKEIARLPAGVFPDGIAYDPDDKKIFVSDELGRAIDVFDAVNNMPLARIELGGEVGNVQYDSTTKRIYAPVQTRNELAVVDPKENRLIERWPLMGADHPHGLRISEDGLIAYVACDENDRLLTVDLVTKSVLKGQPIGRDPDVLAADPILKRLYIASESGNLSVFDTRDESSLRKLGDVFAGGNAHSVAVDPETHLIFLPLADVSGKAVLRILKPR